MTTRWWVTAGAALILASSGTAALAQDRQDRNNQQDRNNRGGGRTQFDEKDRQVAQDWYKQRQNNPPAGFRDQDRLSPEQERRLQPGAQLDPDLRSRVRPAPADLRRRLPRPAKHHRYVTIGGHVGIVDQNYQIRDVIHLHDNR
jgi:Ni/Co efflux regulator RcnB